MVNWQQISTVLLDMDGTLLDLHFDNYFWLEHLPKRFAEAKAISETEAAQTLTNIINAQQGKLNWYCLDYWSRELNMDIPALKHEIQHLIRFRPQVETFLEELKNTHHRVILATNAHRMSLELKLEHAHLRQYMDRIVSSHDFQVPKEDPKFWEHLREVEDFDPESTLLIDDSFAVLHSAQSYGIRHLLTIMQPDSQKPRRQLDEANKHILGIDHFDQILPSKLKHS